MNLKKAVKMGPKEIRDQVVDVTKIRKGHKTISKYLEIPVSTVGSIMQPGTVKTRPSLKTLKELQSSMAETGVKMHQSTISRALHRSH